jgi:RNA polymerase sigma factor (TIGR02999 family)
MTIDRDPSSSMPGEEDPFYSEVYHRLKDLASQQRMRVGDPATICTTELVHEAFLRIGEPRGRFDQELQFFAYAARAMRHILTDAARRRIQPMRGGDLTRIALDDPSAHSVHIDSQTAIELDEALTALEKEDARAAQVVELHYFSGLELQQVADVLGVTRRTIDRDWRYARAFLASRSE